MQLPYDLSVVVCSLNGAAGVDRCLGALAGQTIADRIQVVVVDDGSSDDTSDVARRHGVELRRHEINRGLAAARNTGVAAARAELVAFLDDDCEPEPGWAAALIAEVTSNDVVAVGGPVLVGGPESFVVRYLQRHNPLLPLEMELAGGDAAHYRLWLYLCRQWVTRPEIGQPRDVYAIVGANMMFRVESLRAIGGFDPRFTFGAEELEACLRLREAHQSGRLRFAPAARVRHHYVPQLQDALRRTRAYGRGSARLHAVRPAVPPTVFPVPVAVAALTALGLLARRPAVAAAGLLLPAIVFPVGIRAFLGGGSWESILDPWLQSLQEAAGNLGVAEGWWRYRHGVDPPAHAVVDRAGLDQAGLDLAAPDLAAPDLPAAAARR